MIERPITTDLEVICRIKRQRSDAIKFLTELAIYDLRIESYALGFCFLKQARRAHFEYIRFEISRLKRPSVIARNSAHNNLPYVVQARKRAKKERYWGDPDYRNEFNRKCVEYFKRNKLKVYNYRKSRPDIYKEGARVYIRDWQRHKRQTDPQYNVGNRLRSRLWHAIVSSGGKKAHKTEDLIGCSVAELRRHLESQFTSEMNWDLVLSGKIVIDHKIPCEFFDLSNEDQQRRCFNYTNMQPLWKEDNIRKSDFMPDGTRARHLKRKVLHKSIQPV